MQLGVQVRAITHRVPVSVQLGLAHRGIHPGAASTSATDHQEWKASCACLDPVPLESGSLHPTVPARPSQDLSLGLYLQQPVIILDRVRLEPAQ